jgi:hypothetical protein
VITEFEWIPVKIAKVLRESEETDESALGKEVFEVLTGGRDPAFRLFTADEVAAVVTAVVRAEKGRDSTIMAHVKGKGDVSPDTAEAIHKIVVAAYIEMLVGSS